MLSIIAVIGRNRELGKDNKLLWHVPGDLPRFKQITTGHPVIMGKNTFLSLDKPLSNRTNIVVSNSLAPNEQITVVSSITEALTTAETAPGNEEIFIIGGGTLYRQTIDIADRLYLTIVNSTASADTFFPEYNQFTAVLFQELHQAKAFTFQYLTLER